MSEPLAEGVRPDEDNFEPLSGDELVRIDATSSDSFVTELAQTALFFRQEAMDLRDDRDRLIGALKAASYALDAAGFTFSADAARKAFSTQFDGGPNG